MSSVYFILGVVVTQLNLKKNPQQMLSDSLLNLSKSGLFCDPLIFCVKLVVMNIQQVELPRRFPS